MNRVRTLGTPLITMVVAVIAMSCLIGFSPAVEAGQDPNTDVSQPPSDVFDSFLVREPSSEMGEYRQVIFKNGKTELGEVLPSEDERMRFRNPRGTIFALDWNWVEMMVPASRAEFLLSGAAYEADRGDAEAAAAMIDEARELEPEIAIDAALARSIDEALEVTGDERESQRDALMESIGELVDLGHTRRALRLLEEDNRRHPGDVDVLSEIVRIEYQLRRSEGPEGPRFYSSYQQRLRELDPESRILGGIEAEIAVIDKLRERDAAERAEFLATAVDQARDFIAGGRMIEAYEVIERALAMDPDPARRRQLTRLESQVRPSYEAQLASQRKSSGVRRVRVQARGSTGGSISTAYYNDSSQTSRGRRLGALAYQGVQRKMQDRRHQQALRGQQRGHRFKFRP